VGAVYQVPNYQFQIVSDGHPTASILIGETSSERERFAANELNYFVSKYTGQRLEQIHDQQPIPTRFAIIIGTPDTNQYVRIFKERGDLPLTWELGSEGYVIKSIEGSCAHLIIIGANSPQGTIYGTYGLVEMFIEQLTGLTAPVDLDFYVPPSKSLYLPYNIDKSSKPFYPIRATLGAEEPDWLSRHRINMSGAEGIWTGTGINDGLGSAFKYVDDPRFDDFQDDSRQVRLNRIQELKNRFHNLTKRGIEPYLFMYVTGEPTKALIENHPELLGPGAYYGANSQEFYRPLCWTNPDTRQLIRDLVKEIVNTYPNLAGFHLRSWGDETRACSCDECKNRQQELLWEIYFDIIESALEVKDNFKFYISGYNRSWLQDPDYLYAEKLPVSVVFSRKWGIDGEPTTDPQVSTEFIEHIDEIGHKLLILSHDTEEVMPLWMVEADIFVDGVRKYSKDSLKGLAGFTLQGQNSLAHVDKLISARINWDVDTDYRKLIENYYTTIYGEPAAKYIKDSLLINSWTLSNFFNDYAGIISITGDYRAGSAGFATRFWALVGLEAVADTLAIPEFSSADYSSQRLENLLPQQQLSANKMFEASTVLKPISASALENFQDGVHIMQAWVALFESRLRLVEAVKAGYTNDNKYQVENKIKSAAEYSKELLLHIKSIKNFSPVFNYTDDFYRSSLTEDIQGEIEFLNDFEPESLLKYNDPNAPESSDEFKISEVLNYPNPFSEDTLFIFELSHEAEEVNISIYTINGRLIKKLTNLLGFKGYNEIFYDGRDENGNPISNGVYFYKISVSFEKTEVNYMGKFAVMR